MNWGRLIAAPLLLAFGVLNAVAYPAVAVTVPMKCADGTVVEIEVDTSSDSWRAALTAACEGHGEDGSQENNQSNDPDPVADTSGHWELVGYVCDNGGICASYLRCKDGSPKGEYVFVEADGSRGETRTFCPGDSDIPKDAVTPPTPGEIFSAFKEVAPTEATLSIQPPGGQTLVNFDTIFSTNADPFTTGEIALVPGFKVVFEVFPTAFTWKFGDGEELTTDWAGKPWSEGVDVSTLITHAYSSKRDVKASVTITWGAKASLNGGEPVPVDGTVSVASAMVPLEVLEAVPQLVE